MALARRLSQAGLRHETVEDLETLHACRPPAYADWLEEASAAPGHAVQILENLLDPETIVLTGALPPVILTDLVTRTPLPALVRRQPP